MPTNPYPIETLDPEDDNGTMVENVDTISQAVVGHRITKVEERVEIPGRWYGTAQTALTLTLDNGRRVHLVNTDDCCAHTDLTAFLLHADKVDHIITGVGTTDGYEKWHIYADLGDVLELTVTWSAGNPFYYGYGFDITVEEATE